MTIEHDRLRETREQKAPWKKWGPYLSERQWGTVREDYSENGDAWNLVVRHVELEEYMLQELLVFKVVVAVASLLLCSFVLVLEFREMN
jgi:hypothetical protein